MSRFLDGNMEKIELEKCNTSLEENMNYSKNNIKASWLHISDLHVFHEADTTLMLDDYRSLAKSISPEFLVVTGDFRHKKYKTNFSLAKDYLELLISIFGIDKKNIFFVPGNHDVNYYDGRMDAISDICFRTKEGDYNAYSEYLLGKGFSDYDNFVREFYKGTDIMDSRITEPSGVQCITWNNLINILLVNTALVSDGENHGQIIDINALSECKINPNLPSIMLGHHGIDSLFPCYSERIIGVIDRRQISAYLHGDSHRYANHPISKISTPNNTIPSITCAKSAPQSGDLYSDIGVIYYEWKDDDNTYVQAYRWTQNGFIKDPKYYHHIDKQYYFPMIYKKEDILARSQILYKQIKNIMNNHEIFMAGKWLEEAEFAWKISFHEGIGRCLLVYYYEKATEGVIGAHQRAQEIYHELELISNSDSNTQEMLEVTRKLLYFDKN